MKIARYPFRKKKCIVKVYLKLVGLAEFFGFVRHIVFTNSKSAKKLWFNMNANGVEQDIQL